LQLKQTPTFPQCICARVASWFVLKNPNLGKNWRDLHRFENIHKVCGNLEYYMDIWDILWSFGTSCHLVPFSGFGIMYPKQSGNPDLRQKKFFHVRSGLTSLKAIWLFWCTFELILLYSIILSLLLWNSWTHFRRSYRLEQYVSNECILRFGAFLYSRHEILWNDVAKQHAEIAWHIEWVNMTKYFRVWWNEFVQ
jgi:hypothetical protein